MDDIKFPLWIRNSPSMAMAAVLAKTLRAKAGTNTSSESANPGRQSRKWPQEQHHYAGGAVATLDDDAGEAASESSSEEEVGGAVSQATMARRLFGEPTERRRAWPREELPSLASRLGGHGEGNSITAQTTDILHDPRVQQLLRLSHINELTSGTETSVSVQHAIALVSLMALAVECRGLPGDITKGFLTECSSLFASFMSRLPQLQFPAGFDVEGLVASIIACGLKLRQLEDEPLQPGRPPWLAASQAAGGGSGVANGGRPSSNSGRGTPRSGTSHGPKSVGLSGFAQSIVDSIIMACIPSDIDACAKDVVALGALDGMAYTNSQRPVYLGTQLVTRLHDLMDAFATSPHRRDLSYKKLLSYLMEAISCSAVVDYHRTNRWITAIMQEEYVVRGLFQKEVLHARVVAATLTLIIREYQEVAQEYISKSSGMDGMPDFTEGDQLIEMVWRALQSALSTWEEPPKKALTLYSSNIRVLTESLLHTEVERLRCYYIITSSSTAHAQWSQSQDHQRLTLASSSATSAARSTHVGDDRAAVSSTPDSSFEEGAADYQPYLPSQQEMTLRVKVAQNIIKYLLLPSSVLNMLPPTEAAAALRLSISRRSREVLAIVTATMFTDNPSNSPYPRSFASRQAFFSVNYYREMEQMMEELIRVVLREVEVTVKGRVASLCLQTMCAGDTHLRGFVLSEVMDAVVRLCTESATTLNKDVLAENPRRLSLCFDMLNCILLPKRYVLIHRVPREEFVRYGRLLCDIYEDAVRGELAREPTASPLNMKENFPSHLMTVVADAVWKFVLRVHERLRCLTHDALAVADSGSRREKVQYTNALNVQGRAIGLLMRIVMRCMLSIAWPGSGILYQKAGGGGDRPVDGNTTPGTMAPLALSCLAPLLRSLTILFHLSTLFPVRHLLSLTAHEASARYLYSEDYAAHFIPTYFFEPSSRRSQLYEEQGLSQFRSCWLMLTHYGFTSQALSEVGSKASHASLAAAMSAYYSGENYLDAAQVRGLRLLAASAVPLMQMRSSDMHQAMADVAVLLRYANMEGDPTATSGALHQHLSAQLSSLCGGEHDWRKLSVNELFLMRSLTDLEMLRAASGSIATITLYQLFEIREFVASPAIRPVLQHITATTTTLYLSSLRALLPVATYKLVSKDLHQLVLLYSFSVESVRVSAYAILWKIIEAFPSFAAASPALQVLWTVMNLLDGGSASDIERYCERVQLGDPPAVAADADSDERHRRLSELVQLAELWAARGQSSAPLALFEVATRFVQLQDVAGSIAGTGNLPGSRQAVLAAQPSQLRLVGEAVSGVSVLGSRVKPNYAQILIQRSKAEGVVLDAVRSKQLIAVEQLIIAALQDVIAQNVVAIATVTKTSGEAFHDALAYGTAGEANDADGITAPAADLKVHEAKKSRLAVGRLYEMDAALGLGAAFLTAGRATSSGAIKLLRYLVQGPIHLFSSQYVVAAVKAWTWLLANAATDFSIALLQQVKEGLEWTHAQRIGLFDGARPSQMEEVQTGAVGGGTQRTATIYAADYANNSPHKLLFGFVAEAYVAAAAPCAFDTTVLQTLYELAMRFVECPSHLSLKDTSFGETMRCVLLVGHICRNLHTANTRRLRSGVLVVVPFTSLGLLRQRLYRCLLQWFRKLPPSWYFAASPALACEEMDVLAALVQLLRDECDTLRKSSLGFLDFSIGLRGGKEHGHQTNTWGIASVVRTQVEALRHAEGDSEKLRKLISSEQHRLLGLLRLLELLTQHELVRLKVWQTPRRTLRLKEEMRLPSSWTTYAATAAENDPAVLVAMVARFSSCHELAAAASAHVRHAPEHFAHISEAVPLYLTEEVLRGGAQKLHIFAHCGIVESLRLLDAHYVKHPEVTAYAINSLLSKKSEHLIFYLPQLLQVLATDKSGRIEGFLHRAAGGNMVFCHQLLWSLQTEAEGTTPLAHKSRKLSERIIAEFDPDQKAFYEAEFGYVNLLTSVSAELMGVEKRERKPKVRQRLQDAEFHTPITQQRLYLPTNPDYRVTKLIPNTAGAMQSAAKCPILIQFHCTPMADDASTTSKHAAKEEEEQQSKKPIIKACIFKTGDDCRQDRISLQLIGLFQRIMHAVGVPSYLYPYQVVTTGQDSGVIECVPHALSRNEIGKLVESNLAEYFVQTFGHPQSVAFHRACGNFVKSTAAYSIASFVLNIKDRHNGNIMIDSEGHLVHIDFGFLFDTSPGGDINFESSPFKLTTEMVQLIGMDVGRDSNLRSPSLAKALIDEERYVYFKTLVIRCYLAVRQYAREICILVELMLHSGLPCFKPKQTIANLAHRLSMDKTEIEAADYMRQRIHEARQNVRTVLYDKYQRFAEGIEM